MILSLDAAAVMDYGRDMSNTKNIGDTATHKGTTGTVVGVDRHSYPQAMYLVKFPDRPFDAVLKACEIGLVSWDCKCAPCLESRKSVGRCWKAA